MQLFGKNKPNMNAFLGSFVETMDILSKKGVACVIDGLKMSIMINASVCCVDSVVRAPVQGFTQFKGSYGCNQCLRPGESVLTNKNNPRSGNIKYPLLKTMQKERNAADTIQHMIKASSSKKNFSGSKKSVSFNKFNVF